MHLFSNHHQYMKWIKEQIYKYVDVFSTSYKLRLILGAGVEKGGPGGSRLLQSSSCSPGWVHLRQPGERSPRGTNCNVDVRGGRLASAGGWTYPQKCSVALKQSEFKSSFDDLLSRKVAVFKLHKSTRQQRTCTRRVSTPQEVEADRGSALLQHFFGRKGLAFLCLNRLGVLLPRHRNERRKAAQTVYCWVARSCPHRKIQVGRVLTQREQNPPACHFRAEERSVRQHPETLASGQCGAESSQSMSFLTVLGK